MTFSACALLPSSIRARHTFTQVRTACATVAVLIATPAGHSASTTEPLRLTIRTAGHSAPGTHGSPPHR